eukprot:jgi/Bigna1/71060/fgenesh1_pg.14_\
MSSEYEKLRLKTIEENEAKLKELGIAIPKVEKQKQKKSSTNRRKRRYGAPNFESGTPVRRSSRSRKLRKSFNEMGTEDGDEDSDYLPALEEDEDDDSMQAFNEKAPSSRIRKKKENSSNPIALEHDVGVDTEDVDLPIKVENAKSGRSTCRKCRVKIEKVGDVGMGDLLALIFSKSASPTLLLHGSCEEVGELRIGMKAWIMGRNALTWQHPVCFCENISFTREKSGRGKCKLTGKFFEKNEARLSCSSHTAISNMKLSVLSTCLCPIVEAVKNNNMEMKSISSPKDWHGYENLDEDEQKLVEAQWSTCFSLDSRGSSGSTSDDSLKENTTTEEMQTRGGEKKRVSGKVAWKWGGKTCYGKLIPSREDKTTCYARTKNGKIKTLKKGKSYWWVV